MSLVELTDNLTLVVKGGAAQLSPSQCFRLAEKCLRGATKAIVRAEAAANGPVRPVRDGRNG
jgi:hypothetical protein